MGRIILGAIVGFVVWSILWVGSDAVLSALSPVWYGKHHRELEAAVNDQTPFMSDSTILLIGLLRSVVFSIISGLAAAAIAKENTKSPLGLGILLLLFGIFIQSIFWNYAPLWYHIPFLILLIPMAMLGGRLKKFRRKSMARIIFGAIAGFIVWTMILIGSDQIWLALMPDWYGRHQAELQAAVNNKTPFTADSAILLIAVIRSAILSIITGFIAAAIARENFKSPLLLGVFLLAFGSFIHSMIVANVPFWYHLLILLPLIPLTLLGGRLGGRKPVV